VSYAAGDHIDVEAYRDQVIDTSAGQISPVFGRYINYFKMESSRDRKSMVRKLSAEVKGFHTIDETPSCLISTFGADELPLVLKKTGSKTRVQRGSLSESDVRLIRERYQAGGVSQHALAEEFSVSQKTVSNAVRGVGQYRMAI